MRSAMFIAVKAWGRLRDERQWTRALTLLLVTGFTILHVIGWSSDAQAQERLPVSPQEEETPQPYSAGRAGPSRVIFPDQKIPIRFFHDKHVPLGIACIFCHRTVQRSENSADNNVPKIKGDAEKHDIICLNCHQIFAAEPAKAEPPASCETCHTDYTADAKTPPKPIFMPAPNLKFPHKRHLDNGIRCQRCHKPMEKTQLATRDNFPLMDICLECHNGKTVINGIQPPSACSTCHLTVADGRLQTRYETGLLKPGVRREYYHDDHWLKNHRTLAEANVTLCSSCHAKNFCMDCHQSARSERGLASIPREIHPNNWIALHPKTAYTNETSCSSCHKVQSFCRDCHLQQRVTLDSIPFTARFHPPGWVNFGPRNSGNHSNIARRNIQACSSCHKQNDCLRCHSTRFVGVNPHPKSFSGRSIQRRNPAVCLKCHRPDDPLIR